MYFACSNLVHQLHERKLTHKLHICCTPNENIHSNYFRSHVLCLLESRAPTTRKETHLAPLPQTFPFISFPLSILTTYACPQKKRLFSLLPIFTTSFITSTPTHPTSSKDTFSHTEKPFQPRSTILRTHTHPLTTCVPYNLSSSGLLEVCNEILAILFLLQTRKDHLGSRDVLLGCLEVVEESVLAPRDARLLVGLRVAESRGLTRLPAEKTVEVRALLVGSSRLDSVALRALGLENLGSLLGRHVWCVQERLTKRSIKCL